MDRHADPEAVVDAQVDPTDTIEARRDRLTKAVRRTVCWQEKRQRSAKSHSKRRVTALHRHGIRLSEPRKCS